MSDTESKIAAPAFDNVKVRRVATVTVITCVRHNKKKVSLHFVMRDETFSTVIHLHFTFQKYNLFADTVGAHMTAALSLPLHILLN